MSKQSSFVTRYSYNLRLKELAQKEARIRELEDVIHDFFNSHPCDHAPELHYENPDCKYCAVINKMSAAIAISSDDEKALSEKSDKEDASDEVDG